MVHGQFERLDVLVGLERSHGHVVGAALRGERVGGVVAVRESSVVPAVLVGGDPYLPLLGQEADRYALLTLFADAHRSTDVGGGREGKAHVDLVAGLEGELLRPDAEVAVGRTERVVAGQQLVEGELAIGIGDGRLGLTAGLVLKGQLHARSGFSGREVQAPG